MEKVERLYPPDNFFLLINKTTSLKKIEGNIDYRNFRIFYSTTGNKFK